MIIGICGFISSGKDTIADYLTNFHEFERESFASSLKDAISVIFGWDRQLLEGRTVQSRKWREQVDPWWAERLNMPHLTPRWILQNWGTEVCRQAFHDDIWIASLENKLRSTTQHIVITDCRFPNEMTALRNVGGKIIRVTRGPEPSWYSIAVSANRGSGLSMQGMISENIHSSEWAWVGSTFDAVIDNNGTIDYLYKQINDFINQESNRLDAK